VGLERALKPAEPLPFRRELMTNRPDLVAQGTLSSGRRSELLLKSPDLLQRQGQLVAVIEGLSQLGWFGTTRLARPVGTHPIRVGAPLAWAPALPGNRHTASVTKRNDSVHPMVIFCVRAIGPRGAAACECHPWGHLSAPRIR